MVFIIKINMVRCPVVAVGNPLYREPRKHWDRIVLDAGSNSGSNFDYDISLSLPLQTNAK